MDVLGSPDLPGSRRLGRASYAVLFAMANAIIESGTGVVIESNFYRAQSAAALRALATRGRGVFVHCVAPAAVCRARYASRVRHPGHHDAQLLSDWDDDLAPFEPPEGIATVRVDTTAPVDPRALARAFSSGAR